MGRREWERGRGGVGRWEEGCGGDTRGHQKCILKCNDASIHLFSMTSLCINHFCKLLNVKKPCFSQLYKNNKRYLVTVYYEYSIRIKTSFFLGKTRPFDLD